MKCQRCEKPATIHITELAAGKPRELHLCEEHARHYLSEAEDDSSAPAPNLAAMLGEPTPLTETAEELARMEQKACPICGITFMEFRKQGRLGCPNDYAFFGEELQPLLLNIHGDVEHKGKLPRRHAGDSRKQTELIRLRRDMKQAIDSEDYERASILRDEIRRLETET